ncbi:MAG: hypothetical protein JXB00_06535 [Bacteroidales bacterium]|nr:hypothetical protein [Bacteroidales bacterium]
MRIIKLISITISLLILIFPTGFCQKSLVHMAIVGKSNPRIQFGAEILTKNVKNKGYEVKFQDNPLLTRKKTHVIIGVVTDPEFKSLMTKLSIGMSIVPGKEGFYLIPVNESLIIAGADASGTLYGCLEMADRIEKGNNLLPDLTFTDQPEMVMRGACIGLQKTTYLPGRSVYEYPYTPENFPWFYDKELWIKYLDMLVENRMNALYLWNGHPFASLVRLEEYPFAVEVDNETFEKNEAIFSFLTNEADKRGIYIVQMFYNIIVSKPFAEHYGIKTQDRSRPIMPVIADYTRKSVKAFIHKYPNVGLMVCLGEAMNTIEDDIQWFTETIIPGVKDGLAALGRTEEPPLILRGHDTDAKRVMEAALPLYSNLYTMHKYNGESLTTYEPRGSWEKIHRDLSNLGSVHISNVHILANLEPFRYGSPDFIRKSVIAMHDIQGANGLHLYPQASYWDWPYAADNTNPRLLQVDRDRIWYKAWARYAWNCHQDSVSENKYWSRILADFYKCGEYGNEILKAYEQTGEIAPKLLRRFGISDGNRQTLLLGMFMSQLVNPYKWQVYSNFYSSNGPEGEILLEYAEKEWINKPHKGETPMQIILEVVQHAEEAKKAVDAAERHIMNNNEEFTRFKNDVYCYHAFAWYFAERVRAALFVLKYKYSNNVADLDSAVPQLEKSVQHYEQLVELTKDKYLYANSMQTQQRRIPISGAGGRNKTWIELLPGYEEELLNFKRNIQALRQSADGTVSREIAELQPADVILKDEGLERYRIDQKEQIYSDKDFKINAYAGELKSISGIRFSYEKQLEQGTEIHFSCKEPVKVVVGFFNGNSYRLLQPPSLETNAHANDRGQADIRIANALDVPGLFPVNIYTYRFDAGENVLKFDKGLVLVLGFMKADQDIIMRDAGLGGKENIEGIDWLFY